MEDKKILLIDDIFQVRYSLHQYLAGNGYIVFDADTGFKAIEIYEKLKPDLIITDYNLRDMNCFELLEGIRRYENNLKDVIRIKNVPVIVISGYLTEEKIQPEKKRLGISAFMRKPLVLPQMLIFIEAALGNDYFVSMSTAKEIVICDSEYRTAKYLAGYLSQHQYNTYYCSNILDFIDLVAEDKPDLVLFDCFTDMTGFEAFDIFGICHKNNPDYSLFLTTFHDPCKMINTYTYFGVEQIIHKPIDLESLLNLIQNSFIEKRKRAAERNKANSTQNVAQP